MVQGDKIMSNYSDNAAMCRVDFFKESGKWYDTESVDFTGLYDSVDIHVAFNTALKRHLDGRMKGMRAICLDPYHQHSYPLSVMI